MNTIVYLHDGSEVEHPDTVVSVGDPTSIVVDPPIEHAVLDAEGLLTMVYKPAVERVVVNPDGAELIVANPEGEVVAVYEPGAWRSTTTSFPDPAA